MRTVRSSICFARRHWLTCRANEFGVGHKITDINAFPPGRARASSQAVRVLVSKDLSKRLQSMGSKFPKTGPAVVVYGQETQRPCLALLSGWSYTVRRSKKMEPVRAAFLLAQRQSSSSHVCVWGWFRELPAVPGPASSTTSERIALSPVLPRLEEADADAAAAASASSVASTSAASAATPVETGDGDRTAAAGETGGSRAAAAADDYVLVWRKELGPGCHEDIVDGKRDVQQDDYTAYLRTLRKMPELNAQPKRRTSDKEIQSQSTVPESATSAATDIEHRLRPRKKTIVRTTILRLLLQELISTVMMIAAGTAEINSDEAEAFSAGRTRRQIAATER